MNFFIKNPEALQSCCKVWGMDAQLFLLVEECGELLQAISKNRRNPTTETKADIEEEVADVLIMLYQAIHMFELDNVQEIIDRKQDRLVKRLEEWNASC